VHPASTGTSTLLGVPGHAVAIRVNERPVTGHPAAVVCAPSVPEGTAAPSTKGPDDHDAQPHARAVGQAVARRPVGRCSTGPATLFAAITLLAAFVANRIATDGPSARARIGAYAAIAAVFRSRSGSAVRIAARRARIVGVWRRCDHRHARVRHPEGRARARGRLHPHVRHRRGAPRAGLGAGAPPGTPVRRLLAIPVALAIVYFAIWPVAIGRWSRTCRGWSFIATPADLGLVYADVSMPTDDGVTLSGWHLPSENGAAIAVLHGAGSTDGRARSRGVLHEAGYGALCSTAAGRASGGPPWPPTPGRPRHRRRRHVPAGVRRRSRPSAQFGLSMGGEERRRRGRRAHPGRRRRGAGAVGRSRTRSRRPRRHCRV
jgi:hypothetical protein